MNFTHEMESGKRITMEESEIEKLISHYNDFETWGIIGDINSNESEFSLFYLVTKTPFHFPKNINTEKIDYRELSSVATTSKGAWFCCEYFYSFDEFQKTKYNGTFRIKICKENKPILDWIVSKKNIILLDKAPPNFIGSALHFIHYFQTNPGFILPLKDVSGLAFNDEYMNFESATLS